MTAHAPGAATVPPRELAVTAIGSVQLGSAPSAHLIPARTAWLRPSMSTDLPGIRAYAAKTFRRADPWTDPGMARAALPDSPTRRTGQYARIRARTDAVNLALRFGDLAAMAVGQAVGGMSLRQSYLPRMIMLTSA
jgi:hypothetical protein